jgi:hypothetical protein
MVRRILMTWPVDYMLSRFQWYRRYIGGRWENHFIDICNARMWFLMDPGMCWPDYEQPCSRGAPIIEDWPKKTPAQGRG